MISAGLVAKIEEVLNRLAAESLLAGPGSDDGLIPAYSLLGELSELTDEAPELHDAVVSVRSVLDRLLESSKPFDAGSIGSVLGLVEWFPAAMDSLRGGAPLPALGVRGKDLSPARPTATAGETEGLLKFDLGENRELLGEFHGEALEHLQQIEAALLALERRPDDPEAINSIFRSFHTIKGNSGFLGLGPMHALAHEVETLLDLARNQKLRINSAIVTAILRSRDAIQAMNQQVAAGLADGKQPEAVIPVAHLIEVVRLLAKGETLPAPAQAAAPAGSSPRLAEHLAPDQARARQGAATVRVNTEKLDVLMDVVGELVIVQSQLADTARRFGTAVPPLARNVGQLNRITKELQHTAMSLRMIPIRPTFQKMERLARDLARECGKQAALTTKGGETELDRTMVEEIADPLVHMVRNALDHGLESAEERVALGKPETGTVTLKAFHQGGSVIIELQDDGRGLDPARILAKARRLGLVPPDHQPTPEEIYTYIFLPGFSTADKVTSVSGRGVGMDVVKRNVERLRGKIEIATQLGKGTTFTVKLPLTMAIIDGLVVRIGEDRFILPSTSVQRALRPSRESIVTIQGCGEVLDLRGRMIPLERLNRRFGIVAHAQEPWEGILVIVEASGRLCALLVDEMISKQEVVIKNLGAFLQGLAGNAGVAGGAILGDGNIALILDPAALLRAA